MNEDVVSRDLFLAILAMDAYHHGAGQGIRVNQTKIGYADIETNSDLVFSGFFKRSGRRRIFRA